MTATTPTPVKPSSAFAPKGNPWAPTLSGVGLVARIEMLRRQSPPTQWDTISRDWNEAAREAMKLIRQECPR